MRKIKGLDASYTVEASLVLGIVVLIVLYMVSFTLRLYLTVNAYGERCGYSVDADDVPSGTLRLERIMYEAVNAGLKEKE